LRTESKICLKPVLSEISDLRNFWLHAVCAWTD